MNSENIIINGANRGVGFIILKHFLKSGHKGQIFALCRNEEKAQKIFQNVTPAQSGQLRVVYMDLENCAQIREAIENMSKSAPKIDFLFHAAEFFSLEAESSARKVFSVNLFNTTYFIQEVIKSGIMNQNSKVILSTSLLGNNSIFIDPVIGKCIENASFNDLLHFANAIVKEIDDKDRLTEIVRHEIHLPVYRLSKVFLHRYVELLAGHQLIRKDKIAVACIDPGLFEIADNTLYVSCDESKISKTVLDAIKIVEHDSDFQGQLLGPDLEVKNSWS